MKAEDSTRRAMNLDQRFEPVAALVRGSTVESVHRGALAAVDSAGSVLGHVGDPSLRISLRSVAKPLQALALVESGAAEAFGVSSEELAVVAGSHSGQSEHTRLVTAMLERCAVAPEALVCGAPTHMCSGKHAGMIVLARHLGAPIEGYELPDHPVQQEIERAILGLLEQRPAATALQVAPAHDGGGRSTLFDGTDGCGVPLISLSLDALGWLYALLGAGATPALASVRDAMLAHPELIGGRNTFDTRLMLCCPGRVISKGGAEGVQALALCPPQNAAGPRRAPVGVVLKIQDGSPRPIPLLSRVYLEACGVMVPDEMPTETAPREEWTERALSSGEVIPLFEARVLGWGEEVAEETLADDLKEELKHGRLVLVEGRGDEKDLTRFLRDEWPLSDEETFGRATQWIADPYALTLRHKRKVLAVLKGHFLGGLASVDEFIVGHEYRSRGVGAHMLVRFEEEAHRRRCARVVLRTVKGGRAESFYRRLGYQRECVQLDYEFGEDFVRLAKRLKVEAD